MKKERLASLLMTGVIMASTVVSASAMQFPQDVYYGKQKPPFLYLPASGMERAFSDHCELAETSAHSSVGEPNADSSGGEGSARAAEGFPHLRNARTDAAAGRKQRACSNR